MSAGLRGGLLTAALLCARSWAEGSGGGLPLKAAAALWLGPPALLGGAWTDLLGLATHLAACAALGGLFAALLGRSAGPRRALAAGLVYGAALWALERAVLLPWLDETLAIRVELAPGWWLFVTLVFGACLATVPARRQRSVEELSGKGEERKAATFY